MAKARPAIPKATKEAVLKEFNHLCAICGAVSPQIHHIDEDHSNNEVGNLLPLCPNHHLSDQHNPTRKIEPARLRLFREHKDPAILKPQFEPLFTRMSRLFEINCSHTTRLRAAIDLCEFVEYLEMGKYYSEQISCLLVPHHIVGVADLEFIRRIHRSSQLPHSQDPESLETYVMGFENNVSEQHQMIREFIVELLRYQDWPESRKQT